MEAYEKLKQLVANMADDIAKAEGGNKAAGTRARQALQEVKKAAQEAREAIIQARDAGKPAKSED